ncbi:MAG: aldo/keto reductase [Phycisphaerae bacterium]
MQKRKLGDTGETVTAVGYGAWAIGGLGYGPQDDRAAMEAIRCYLDGGGRFIDTARGYGVSEILVGKALQEFDAADEVYVASKSGAKLGAIVRTDLENSRFCLQRDTIDLYYVHVPPKDPDDLKHLLDAYQQLKEAGKIRHIGVSCLNPDDPSNIEHTYGVIEDERVDVIQVVYSIARPMLSDLITKARERGIGVVARMNLEGGFLTGKYRPGHVFEDTENDWRAQIPRDRLDAMIRSAMEMSQRCVNPPYENLAQVALSFALSHPGVSAIIPGGRSTEQVRANLAVDALPPLSESLQEQLIQAAEPLRIARVNR